MYEMSDLTKLAVFALQYACALIGALIAVQLVVIAGGNEISPSDQTPTASERLARWGPGRGAVYHSSQPEKLGGPT
jgi:hypothetical protein